jgi:hypothetical protein
MTDVLTLETLEARIARLEAEVTDLRVLKDVEEIKRFHRRYVRALADREFGTLLDFFDDAAVVDMRTHGEKRGKGQIAEHFAPLPGAIAEGSGYVLSSPVITVEGDRATGEWTWHRLLPPDASPGGWLEGRYRCAYVRRDGAWKFASMWFRVVLPEADPA